MRIAVLCVVLLAAAAGLFVRGCTIVEYPVTLTSLSPDDQSRVELVEVETPFSIDRNFQLRLEDVKSGQSRVVFRSPDEGRPIGSERVFWSSDSSRFVLVGRHFYAAGSVRLSTGETAYLMMDVVSDQIWCNATQQSEFKGFSLEDLRAVNWLGWSPEAEQEHAADGSQPFSSVADPMSVAAGSRRRCLPFGEGQEE